MKKSDYYNIQGGISNSYKTSYLLSDLIRSAQQDFFLLKSGIINRDLCEWKNGTLFIERVAQDLSLHKLLSILDEIENSANTDHYDLGLYYQMIKEWSKEICNLRTRSNKISYRRSAY